MDQQHLPVPIQCGLRTAFYTSLVGGAYGYMGRRGNHTVYIAGIIPYILGADGVKNSLVGAHELFCN